MLNDNDKRNIMFLYVVLIYFRYFDKATLKHVTEVIQPHVVALIEVCHLTIKSNLYATKDIFNSNYYLQIFEIDFINLYNRIYEDLFMCTSVLIVI